MLDTKDTAVNKTKFLLSCVLNSSGVLKTGETKQKYIGHKAVRESGPWETGNKWSCLWLSPLYCLETISRLQCWKASLADSWIEVTEVQILGGGQLKLLGKNTEESVLQTELHRSAGRSPSVFIRILNSTCMWGNYLRLEKERITWNDQRDWY